MSRELKPQLTNLEKDLKRFEFVRSLKSKVSFLCTVALLVVLNIVLEYHLNPDIWFYAGFCLWGVGISYLFCLGTSLKIKVLSAYIKALQDKKFEEAIEKGKEYYSVKRKGFLGMDGYSYDSTDETQIENDLQSYL